MCQNALWITKSGWVGIGYRWHCFLNIFGHGMFFSREHPTQLHFAEPTSENNVPRSFPIHSPSTTWLLAISWNSVWAMRWGWYFPCPPLSLYRSSEERKAMCSSLSWTHLEKHNADATNQILWDPLGEINSGCGLWNTSWKTQHFSQTLNCEWGLDTWRWEEEMCHRNPGLGGGRGSWVLG